MDEKQKLLKEIERIQKLPIPSRWRAAHDFARDVNPEVRAEQLAFKREIRKMREAQENKFASAKKSGLRFGVSMPVSTVAAIRAFDPEFLMESKKETATSHGTNKTVRILMKTFPEYRIPREI